MIALCVYRCEIAGVRHEQLDFRVRMFNGISESAVRDVLFEEPVHAYLNDAGESVAWPLVGILDIQPWLPGDQGRELAGFIASAAEIARWADSAE